MLVMSPTCRDTRVIMLAIPKRGIGSLRESLYSRSFWAKSQQGIYVVANSKAFPMISDGACSVVHVLYDADESKLISLTCNGRA